MNKSKFVKVIILVFFMIPAVGCEEPQPPAVSEDVITYSVEAGVSGITADITYYDVTNSVVTVEDAALPWSIDLTPEEGFNGRLYLKAKAPESSVFVSFTSGTVSSWSSKKLIDSTADFDAAGVETGDIIYKDPSAADYAEVRGIENSTTLQLNTDLFSAAGEAYYIYRLKTMEASISLNDEELSEDSDEGVRILEVLVKAATDRFSCDGN